jgi:hypothetical protein
MGGGLPSEVDPGRRVGMDVKPRNCVRCGVEIPAERIEMVPKTRLCVDCCREAVGGYEFRRVRKVTRLGKVDSLKKNYGDVTAYDGDRKPVKPKDE